MTPAPLICIPHAGGAASELRPWKGRLGAREVRPVCLPGREQRFNEGFLASVEEMAAFVVRTAASGEARLALWGHSLGALVAYEAALLLEARGVEVQCLFAAGHAAPGIVTREHTLHQRSDAELVAGLRALGGLDPAVEESDELMELLLPRFRADLRAAETYRPAGRPLLSCPVMALGGTSDPDVPRDTLEAWRRTTRGPFAPVLFEGGHFFPRTSLDQVLSAVSRQLDQAALP